MFIDVIYFLIEIRFRFMHRVIYLLSVDSSFRFLER